MRNKRSVGSKKSVALTIGEIATLIVKLSRIYEGGKTGNKETAISLRELSNVLRGAAPLTIEEFGRVVQLALSRQKKTGQIGTAKSEPTLSASLGPIANLSLDRCASIVNNSETTKEQLITLANERFGLPKGNLRKLGVDSVREELVNRISHEQSLDIIAEEASRAGQRRGS